MTETTQTFGPEMNLLGTFTLPDGPAGPTAGGMVLLTNAGLISRIGPNRINVHLARRFAALGIPSFRFDMAGLGDSGRPRTPLPMGEQTIADTRAAMDEAQRRYGISRFVMIGFCSGAEAAYTSALQDARLVGIVLFDLFTYPTWKTHLIRVKRRIRRYGLLSTLWRVSLAILRHLKHRLAPPHPVHESEWGAATPHRQAFAARLDELYRRGTRSLILYSVESELYNYEKQFEDGFKRFGIIGKVDYQYLLECNHVFTTPESQKSLLAITVDWVLRRCFPGIPERGHVDLTAPPQGGF